MEGWEELWDDGETETTESEWQRHISTYQRGLRIIIVVPTFPRADPPRCALACSPLLAIAHYLLRVAGRHTANLRKPARQCPRA